MRQGHGSTPGLKEEKDQRQLDLRNLVDKLRHVTTAVQIIPFVYVPVYMVALMLYYHASEDVLWILDTLFYVSPMTVLAFLVLSKALKLCKWHRRAVALPLIPQAFTFLDYYVIDFSEVVVTVNFCIIITMAVLLMIAAYHVFLK